MTKEHAKNEPAKHADAQIDKKDLAAQQKADDKDLRVDPQKVAAQSVERQKLDEMGVDEEKARLLTEKPFDYIERTRPEDPAGVSASRRATTSTRTFRAASRAILRGRSSTPTHSACRRAVSRRPA